MSARITVCDDCAAGIANDDWSHLDHPDHSDTEQATVDAFLEEGWLSSVGPARSAGYYRCPCCGSDAIGGHTFEREAN